MIHVIGKYRRYIEPVQSNYVKPVIDPQIIVSDGGPWASHNVACPVCGDNGAIMDLSQGVFMPCDTCKYNGWTLKRKRRWRRRA